MYTFKDQWLTYDNQMYRGCSLYFNGGTERAEAAFNEIKEQVADLMPPGFRFDYHSGLFMRDAIIWGGPINAGNKLTAFRKIEKDFIAKVNRRFAGETHYQTAAEMIKGEMQHRLQTDVVEDQYAQLKGITLKDEQTIFGRISADEKKGR